MYNNIKRYRTILMYNIARVILIKLQVIQGDSLIFDRERGILFFSVYNIVLFIHYFQIEL